MLRLYDFLPSGNGYKVRLLLTQLGIPFERVEINILKGESRTPEFLNKNANGRIPVLQLESGEFLAESNAILFYFSENTEFLPNDRLLCAQVLQWLFFEQYSHEPNIATSRFWLSILNKVDEYKAALSLFCHLDGRKS
jgi:glutathione S-transferase